MSKPKQRIISFKASPSRVEDDVIYGCSICTAGPALGHGVMLDEPFIREVYEQGSKSKVGIKARFGHPNMCNEALGTFLGRFRNFSMIGNQVYADLHIAKSSHSTPHGDIGKYVVDLAKDDPEAFGTSIVFSPGESRFEEDDDGNEVEYATCDKLLGCDFVDEPAANPGGLFSSATVAGKVTEFLNAHPEVVSALSQDSEMLDIVASYGKNAAEFIKKYQETVMSEPNETVEPVEEVVEELASEEVVETADESVDTVVEEVELEAADEVAEEVADEPVEALAPDALSVYRSMIKTYGLAIADRVLEEGGGELDAMRYRTESLESELKAASDEKAKLSERIKELEAEVAKLQDVAENDAASFVNGSHNPISELKGLAKAQAALKAKKK